MYPPLCQLRVSSWTTCRAGFSLVEIVLALGLLSFVVSALLGAFAVGMTTDRESVEELEATHILQTLIAERRANPLSDDPNLLLPPLDLPRVRNSANALSLDEAGRPLTESRSGKFGLVYRVMPDAELKSAAVYCAIFWPGRSAPGSAYNRVEIATRVDLP